MRLSNPFHEGERLVQDRAGERQDADANGQVLADTIMRGALPFLRHLPMVVLGVRDRGGRPWGSLVFGDPGFLQSEDGTTVEIDLTTVHRADGDPLWSNLVADHPIGLVAIDLATRRRLRVNGTATGVTPDRLTIAVAEAFPNCPKFIQRRFLKPTDGPSVPAPRESRSGTIPTADGQAIIGAADTFFVVSSHPQRGIDVSHRGGQPGFVRLLDERTLLVPDYPGNSMFNTLGNFSVDPRAGLIFPDFTQKRALHLTGTADILWDEPDVHGETGGTARFWKFTVAQWIETALPARIDWEFLDASPYNPQCFV